MNIMKSTLTISALMGLTACGGSNAPLTFDQIAEQGSTIALEIIDLPFTDPSTLPTSGSATYDGFVGVEIVKWSGKFGQRAKMYPTRLNGYKNDKATEFFRQV